MLQEKEVIKRIGLYEIVGIMKWLLEGHWLSLWAGADGPAGEQG